MPRGHGEVATVGSRAVSVVVDASASYNHGLPLAGAPTGGAGCGLSEVRPRAEGVVIAMPRSLGAKFGPGAALPQEKWEGAPTGGAGTANLLIVNGHAVEMD